MSFEDETPLNLVFLPFPEAGHMIPMADLAKLFSLHTTARCNIITTPANISFFKSSHNNNSNNNILIHTLNFPGPAVGLPPGVENFSSATSPESTSKLAQALNMLQKPTQDLIRQIRPDCIISDPYFPWTVDLADEMGIGGMGEATGVAGGGLAPLAQMHGPMVFRFGPPAPSSQATCFSKCCEEIIMQYAPHDHAKNHDDLVELPLFPHKIIMKISQLPKWVRAPNNYTRLKESIRESKLKSYGALDNSFPCDVEKEYEEFYKSLTGLKVWNVGPFCLRAPRAVDTNDVHHCWAHCCPWLDQKKPRSVLFVSFGSMTRFADEQLREIAAGLESSGHDFIWAVRKKKQKVIDDEEEDKKWSWLEEFRKKMEETKQGLVIENWAPQVLILKHEDIGAMVTHCGWNSILEGVTIVGLPLVTWPLFAEQFYNERYVVDALKIGVAVGSSMWCEVNEIGTKEIIKREKIEAIVREVMGQSEGVVEMRHRAMEHRQAANKAVESGGSSHANLVVFLDELKANRFSKAG